jgi:thioredoxin reductase
MVTDTDVAIVGAGPYGLSIAAYLRHRGLQYRIFGSPMRNWIANMPRGMLLKSEGFASDIYDPQNDFTLRRFCEEQNIPYADIGIPVDLQTFISYGRSFQSRFVPFVEDKILRALTQHPSGFMLQFQDGMSVTARKVIIAVGLTYYQHMPEELSDLPRHLVTHSAIHSEPSRFKGRDVSIIGGGASAIDLAVLLAESGADVELITRNPSVDILSPMKLPRSLWKRLSNPNSGIGPGWRSWCYCSAPSLFHYLPAAIRIRQVRVHISPAAGWPMKDRFHGVKIRYGLNLTDAKISGDKVTMNFAKSDGTTQSLVTSHVIAATGYRVDLNRLPFLCGGLRNKVKSLAKSPVLSASFESSVPGLYFVGTTSANSFGPPMRFAVGAKFTAQRLVPRLAKALRS